MLKPVTLGFTVLTLLLSGCSGTSESASDAAPRSTVDVGEASAVTPISDDVMAAARQEGKLLIYGNPNDDQMEPVIKAFEAAHPEISVKFLSLGGPSTFQRYQSEAATGSATADIIIENDGRLWRAAVDDGHIVDYTDPNLENLPDYASLLPGVAAMSMEPLVALFNKAIVPPDQQPDTLAGMVELAERFPGKVTTPEPETSLGYAGIYGYIDKTGDEGWETLEALGPHTQPEDNAGTMVTQLLQGAYVASFHMSGAVRALSATEQAEILNFRYLTDDTVLVPRGMAITKAAASPNAAKVFYNWLLSVEGQQVSCKGGFTPYRSGVECSFGVRAIEEEIGADSLIYVDYSAEIIDDQEDLIKRFNSAFNG